jgi:hypothetical protein
VVPNAVIEPYELPGEVEYLQVAASSVLTPRVVDVVPEDRVPVGVPPLTKGGVEVEVVVKVWSEDMPVPPPFVAKAR